MGDLLIKDVPEDLVKDFTEVARQKGQSVSESMKGMIKKAVADQRNSEEALPGRNAYEEMRALFADIPDEDREIFAEIMDEVEAQRKVDFGRPFSFVE